jgi:tetratricopeptide (TPR) repeat protein
MPATDTIVVAGESGYRWHAVVLAAVTLAAIFVYLNTLSGDFVWDDRKLIVDDPAITSWAHLTEIFSNDFFCRNEDEVPYGYYRPLTTTSYLLDYTIWGLRPFGYHLTNVLLHAACTATVALILLRLGFGLSASGIAALLFAVHPIHTENVAWIAGRTDLLAFFFTGVALLLHPLGSTRDTPIRDALLPRAAGASRARRRLLLAASVLAFALALLAKEMSVVLTAWLGLIHLLVRRHTWRASAIAVAPYVCVLALYLVWRFLIIQVWLPGELSDHRLSSTLFSSGPTIVRYLIWMLVPIDLNAYVQNPYVTTLLDPRFLGSLFVLVVLGVMLWQFATERALLLAAMLAVSFVPVLNFVRAAAPADMGNMMAERFCYFASFPFLALIGVAIARALACTVRIAPLRYVLSASLIVVAALGALRTVERNRDWNNELSFLTKTLEQSPRAVLLWGNLADYHLRRRNLDRATKAIEQVEALDPNSHAILSSRALWYVVSGRLAEAIPLQKRIVREAGRGQTAALNNLAYLYRMTGQQEQAQSILEALIRSGANRADPHFNLAEIYHARGQPDEARSEYQLALEDRPNDLRTAEALAGLEVNAGRADAAETIYRRMLAVYPDDVRIWNNLALVRHGQGDKAGALAMLAHVVQIQPGYLKARINYAQLLHDSGRTSEAVAQLEMVIRAGLGTELGTVASQQLVALQSDPGARVSP